MKVEKFVPNGRLYTKLRQPDDNNGKGRGVYLTNVPINTSHDQLIAFLTSSGISDDCRVLELRSGFYLLMNSYEQAEEAKKNLNGKFLGSRQIRAGPVVDNKKRTAAVGAASTPATAKPSGSQPVAAKAANPPAASTLEGGATQNVEPVTGPAASKKRKAPEPETVEAATSGSQSNQDVQRKLVPKKQKGYTLWQFPGLVLDPTRDFRDPRSCERANEVLSYDKPHLDTLKLFKRSIEWMKATNKLSSDWQQGMPLFAPGQEGELLSDDNMCTTKKEFSMPRDFDDTRLVTSCGFVIKERMPADLGLDWGGYMQFYAWQSVGRHLKKEMTPFLNHTKEYNRPVKVKFDDGETWEIPAPSDWLLKKVFGQERKPLNPPKTLRESMQMREDRAEQLLGNPFGNLYSPHF